MKAVRPALPEMTGLFLVMLVITSVICPVVIAAVASMAFGHEASGLVIMGKDGIKYRGTLLAQEFTGNQYLWGRVMNVDTGTFTDENGESLVCASASNKIPADSEFEAITAERVEEVRVAHPEKGEEPIPVDLVTCSGSGLDPEISPVAADYRAERIAKERSMTMEDVEAVINRYTADKFLEIFGESRVNMLKANPVLDGLV